jgi:hypothetical protein
MDWLGNYPLLIFAILIVVGALGSWLVKLRMKRKLEEGLGREVRDEDVTSISAWMKTDNRVLSDVIADSGGTLALTPGLGAPTVGRDASAVSIKLTGRLFSVGQIVLATFLGAPLAGALLFARNYQVLGKSRAAWQTLALGVVSTGLVILIALLLPKSTPGMLLPVLYVLGMRQLATHFQGRAISEHQYAGGRKGSWATSVAVGLLGLVCVVVAVFISAIAFAIVAGAR